MIHWSIGIDLQSSDNHSIFQKNWGNFLSEKNRIEIEKRMFRIMEERRKDDCGLVYSNQPNIKGIEIWLYKRETYRLTWLPESSWKPSLFQPTPSIWIPTSFIDEFQLFFVFFLLLRLSLRWWQSTICIFLFSVQLSRSTTPRTLFYILILQTAVRRCCFYCCDQDDVEWPKLDDQSRIVEPFKRTCYRGGNNIK